MAEMGNLAGRVAVVTGGGSGFGEAMARAFAEAGMSVAVLDIDEARAAAVAESLGDPAMAMRVDVADGASVARAAAAVQDRFGRCHLVCANVGVQQFGSIDRVTEAEWRWVFEVNVLGTVRTVQTFLPLVRASDGWRQIAITASSGVFNPGVRVGAYAASKSAVMCLGETLRLELADEGIGVTVIFTAGMTSRHLESSAAARPSSIGEAVVLPDDIDAMMRSRNMDAATHVTSPERAARNVLTDLLANEPFHLTHGAYRPQYEDRLARIGAAFDRMERS
jgi:NAD(P)-dependent dehydrogenase (short-subunit alcohol dehydrogenase family)